MIRILWLLPCLLPTGVHAFVLRTPASMVSSTAVFYRNEQVDASVAQTTPQPTEKQQKVVLEVKKKPTIFPICSLDELYDFLQEDDDRLTAIKFHAPWCKVCQRLGKRYQRMAMKWGDGVDQVARKAVKGEMRCAEVEYSSVTSRFIHDQLQIKGLPTMQLYKGTTKLFQARGGSSITKLEKEIKQLLTLSPCELEQYVINEVEDDGILEEAMEDSFFDNAYID